MTRYQRRALLPAVYWLVVVVSVALAWEVSLRTVFPACIAGAVGGLALAVPDARNLPTRVLFSRVLLTQSEVDGRLMGYCSSLLLFVFLPRFLPIPVSYPEPVLLLVLTLGAGLFTYFSWLLGVVIVRERRLGPILRETVFFGAVGLPEVLRGWPVVIRNSEGATGTAEFADMLWDVRSATDDSLVPGQLASLIAIDNLTLLVLQRREDDG